MIAGQTITIEGICWQVRRASSLRIELVPASSGCIALMNWRSDRGYSLRQAASYLGCSRTMVHYMETGQRSIPGHLLAFLRTI